MLSHIVRKDIFVHPMIRRNKRKTFDPFLPVQSTWGRIVVVLCFAALLLPIYYQRIAAGLDPSWMYGCNLADPSGWKFGSSINLTYGPLGYLAYIMDVGTNIGVGTAIWICVYALNLLLLTYAVFHTLRDQCRLSILFSLSFLAVAYPLAADYYIAYLVLLAVALAWHDKRSALFFSVACALVVFGLFVKFSIAVANFAALFLYIMLRALREKRFPLGQFLILTLCPVAFSAAYLIYNPSLQGLADYVHYAAEISSGYSLAMSGWQGSMQQFALIWLLCGVYSYMSIIALIRHKYDGALLMLCCGLVFLAFKHALTRFSYAHIAWGAAGIAAVFSICTLFMNFDIVFDGLPFRRQSMQRSLTPAVICLFIVALLIPNFDNVGNQISRVRTLLYESKRIEPPVEGIMIPKDVLALIGDETVTVYPMELSVAAYNDIRFVPMPIFQAYTTYTAKLDERNAAFFEDAGTAPRYILFSCYSIDGRYPLWETPETMRAILENYIVVRRTDWCLPRPFGGEGTAPVLVLGRRENARALELQPGAAQTVPIRTEIPVPDEARLYAVSIQARLSRSGQLAKLLYRIPPLYLEMEYADGSTSSGRILLDVLQNDAVLINSLRQQDVISALTGQPPENPTSIRLTGGGLQYYSDQITVSFSAVSVH